MKLKLIAASAAAVCASLLPVYAGSSAQTTPVVVELFTSEGCSSCPPADTLLSRYIKNSPVAGVEVIALGEHVDYWNHGGWADPFSKMQFSIRQGDYSAAFHLDGVSTPQIVVDGRIYFDGGKSDAARAAFRRAARFPKAHVSVAETGPDQLSIQVGSLPKLASDSSAEVYLAVTEDGLTSSVGGGENSGLG